MKGIRCPVCQRELRVSLSRSKSGKVAVMLVCPKDGRHFRGFINDREFVASVVNTLDGRT